MDLSTAISTLEKLQGKSLTQTLARLEASIRGATAKTSVEIVTSEGVNADALAAAGLVKRMAGQINVVIHALGILLCLPHLLQDEETVEYVSLGAGNTGRAFDLETNQRIAEFKFIQWQGGPESIRQNGIFKDFYLLAENPTPKKKYLYLVGTEHPLRFFNGGRKIASVLSRNVKILEDFQGRFGDKFQTVREYFEFRKTRVMIQVLSQWVPGLSHLAAPDPCPTSFE